MCLVFLHHLTPLSPFIYENILTENNKKTKEACEKEGSVCELSHIKDNQRK
jgi:hypothetical protein